MRPLVAGCRPRIIRRVEVLPAPFGPRKPQIDPFSTWKLRSETAWKPPYLLLIPSSVSAATIRFPCNKSGIEGKGANRVA
ncbi:hypothetical protein D3C80_1253600 [compost metagenome]